MAEISGPLTLDKLEDALLRHFIGRSREAAQDLFSFCVLKTLRGPKLSTDNHVAGKQFYFHWCPVGSYSELV